MQGILTINRELIDKCVNDEDLFTCEEIKNIDRKYLFSYKDNKGFIYAFDIRSFKKGLEFNKINPYSQREIPESIINRFNLYYSKS